MRKYILFESKHNQIERGKGKGLYSRLTVFPCLVNIYIALGWQMLEIHWLRREKIELQSTLGLFVRNISVASGELALYRAIMAAVMLLVFFLLIGGVI